MTRPAALKSGCEESNLVCSRPRGPCSLYTTPRYHLPLAHNACSYEVEVFSVTCLLATEQSEDTSKATLASALARIPASRTLATSPERDEKLVTTRCLRGNSRSKVRSSSCSCPAARLLTEGRGLGRSSNILDG